MKVFTYKDEPIKVFGVPFFEQRQTLYRLPDELIEKPIEIEEIEPPKPKKTRKPRAEKRPEAPIEEKTEKAPESTDVKPEAPKPTKKKHNAWFF